MRKHLRKPEKRPLSFALLTLLIIFCCAHGEVSAQRVQRINITVEETSLDKVFDIISGQSEYNFVYGDDYLANVGQVTMNLRNASIDEVLEKALKGSGLWYRIEGKEIIIVSPKLQQPGERKAIRTITGYVTDSKGNPLPGVLTVIKGTNRGAITDGDGIFSFPIPEERVVIRFSFIGMETQDVPVSTQRELSIKMKESTTNIDNIVVTAYGVVQKKEDLVGSAYQVNSEQLKTLPAARVDRMLDGLVPGFTIKAQIKLSGGSQPIQYKNTWREFA